jgi:hypothetical protein
MNKFSLFASLFLIGCNHTLTEPEAREVAQTRFSQVCVDHGYDQHFFVGPIQTTNGPKQFEYQWRQEDPRGNFTILVIVWPSGVESTFLGREPHSGYESK